MDEGLPPCVEPFFDQEELGDSDGDFDGPVQEDLAEPQSQVPPDAPKLSQRLIKTYVIKRTAYKM